MLSNALATVPFSAELTVDKPLKFKPSFMFTPLSTVPDVSVIAKKPMKMFCFVSFSTSWISRVLWFAVPSWIFGFCASNAVYEPSDVCQSVNVELMPFAVVSSPAVISAVIPRSKILSVKNVAPTVPKNTIPAIIASNFVAIWTSRFAFWSCQSNSFRAIKCLLNFANIFLL